MIGYLQLRKASHHERPAVSATRARCGSRFELERLVGEVLCQPIITCVSMAFHTLGASNARAGSAYRTVRFATHTLIGHGLYELANAQAAGIARSAFGWQDVVRARGLVTIGNVGFFTQKHRTAKEREPTIARKPAP